jgi:hypothetical protein
MGLSDVQKGRIIEQLVAATLALQSEGRLRVSVPLVDDEGVDLVVGNRANDKTFLLQVKSRYVLAWKHRYRANVRRATCKPDVNKYLLFVYFDKSAGVLWDTCWLVRADEFCSLLKKQNRKDKKYLFIISFDSPRDMWRAYRLPLKDLAKKIEEDMRNSPPMILRSSQTTSPPAAAA